MLKAHIWPSGDDWLAWQSVFGFYTLSGFLMTRVLNERYGFRARGFAAFAINRVLRLWPAYMVVMLGTMALCAFFDLSKFSAQLVIPHSIYNMLTSFTIVGLVGVDQTMNSNTYIVPNSWSLSIEVACYLLLALYFAKSPARLLALAAFGVVALAYSTVRCELVAAGHGGAYCFQARYGVVQAGFIPFAVGGLAYYYRKEVAETLRGAQGTIVALYVIAFVSIAASRMLQLTVGPFLGTALMAASVAIYSDTQSKVRFADFLGRASYHFFIAHWVIAALLVTMLAMRTYSPALCAATFAGCFALSCVLVPIEWRIERLRRRVKANIATGMLAAENGELKDRLDKSAHTLVHL